MFISAESEVEGLFRERPEALWVAGGGRHFVNFPPAACIEEKQLLHF